MQPIAVLVHGAYADAAGRDVPAGAQPITAERAGSRRTVEIPGAPHVVGMSHPQEAVQLVRGAVGARTAVGC